MDNLRRQHLDRWEATPADFADQRWGREHEGEWAGMTTDPAAWQDAVAMVHFRAGRVAEVVLHPIDLGFQLPRPQRGRPVLAGPEVAREVLERFQRLCAPYGTPLRIVDGRGVISLPG